jgi:hypothetical protein
VFEELGALDPLTAFGRFVRPRWRHNVQATWHMGPFGATLAHNFTLGYRDEGGARRVASYETYDGQVMWEGWRWAGHHARREEVLDRDPPGSARNILAAPSGPFGALLFLPVKLPP